MEPAVAVSADALRAIEGHARAAAPDECCGLLLGTADRVLEAVAARNTAADPRRRYTIDPHDHFAAIRRARLQALDVVGAYHSHPRSPARPSETDRADAFGEFLFLIISLASEPPLLSGWRYVDGNFTPVPIVRTP